MLLVWVILTAALCAVKGSPDLRIVAAATSGGGLAQGLTFESFGHRNTGLGFIVALHQSDEVIQLRQFGCNRSLYESPAIFQILHGRIGKPDLFAVFLVRAMLDKKPVGDFLKTWKGEAGLLRMPERRTAAFHGTVAADLGAIKGGQFIVNPLLLKLGDERTVILDGPANKIGYRGGWMRFHGLPDDLLQLFSQSVALHSSPYLNRPTGLKPKNREKYLQSSDTFNEYARNTKRAQEPAAHPRSSTFAFSMAQTIGRY